MTQKCISLLSKALGSRNSCLVYYFKIWNKEPNIIISWVISSHMGPNYIDSHWLFTDVIMQTLWVHGPSSKMKKKKKWSRINSCYIIFFKWRQLMGWDIGWSSANSWVHLRRLLSMYSLKVSQFRSDERPGLGALLRYVSPERTFKNQFGTFWTLTYKKI